ncbi:hypothetical protein C8F04DRAFT_1172979 [Mycena alexandri]|uniref:Uncharacterized protein n=1 Tax=Mycena alexandri TaxID=1745969 RepID=A0AAD6THX2_9AGAR|nr:hypothetical protein C8F04DRAFT_1172979 [Mycena alexandri]
MVHPHSTPTVNWPPPCINATSDQRGQTGASKWYKEVEDRGATTNKEFGGFASIKFATSHKVEDSKIHKFKCAAAAASGGAEHVQPGFGTLRRAAACNTSLVVPLIGDDLGRFPTSGQEYSAKLCHGRPGTRLVCRLLWICTTGLLETETCDQCKPRRAGGLVEANIGDVTAEPLLSCLCALRARVSGIAHEVMGENEERTERVSKANDAAALLFLPPSHRVCRHSHDPESNMVRPRSRHPRARLRPTAMDDLFVSANYTILPQKVQCNWRADNLNYVELQETPFNYVEPCRNPLNYMELRKGYPFYRTTGTTETM